LTKREGLPISYGLEQNYPEPFYPATAIRFSVPSGRADRLESVEPLDPPAAGSGRALRELEGPRSAKADRDLVRGAGGSLGFVSLRVFDVLGREVSTLVNDRLPAGTYTVPFNASALPSGVYFYRLQAGTRDGRQLHLETKKLVLTK